MPEAIGSEEFVANPPHARQWSRYSPYGYLGPCPNWDPNVPVRTDTYSFTLYAFYRLILELPPVDPTVPNFVRVLDESFASVAIAVTELRGMSDATPSSAPVPPVTAAARAPSLNARGTLRQDGAAAELELEARLRTSTRGPM